MAEKLTLEVVSPDGLVLKEEVDEVEATGSEGEFGVLPGHVPLVTILKIGMLVCRKGGTVSYVFINSGYAEINEDRVLILADSAEREDNIDVERARNAMKRAEERLRKQEEIDFVRAQAALDRAIIRVQLAEKQGHQKSL
ncbi:MAG TPA: F0F1 ATP synthase subunit epsilon [Nitrospirae bacterium]|nr:F0F1 ATP synthase subunit epsilon [Nitrospirota bacterium]